jgi:hypothetical protein
VGTTGYRLAEVVDYRPDDVIIEVGSGESTRYLATLGPPVVTIDADPARHADAAALPNVEAHLGRAEDVLRGWNRPVGFAWLDGHDWPYVGNPAAYYADQRARYRAAGQPYSRDASRRSHLAIATLLAAHTHVVAFDDTWRTHPFRPTADDGDACAESVPPATTPAPALAMNEAIDRSTCGLTANHPHHDRPEYGWNGKGGTAVPYLVGRGFTVVEYGLGTVVLRRPA